MCNSDVALEAANLNYLLSNLFICVLSSPSFGFRNCSEDPEARVRFPALTEKKNLVGLERGALSLVSTN
jgi:hypothetical protein